MLKERWRSISATSTVPTRALKRQLRAVRAAREAAAAVHEGASDGLVSIAATLFESTIGVRAARSCWLFADWLLAVLCPACGDWLVALELNLGLCC